MTRPSDYPINAAELARRIHVDGKQLNNVLRAYPAELAPGHDRGTHYRIDRAMAEQITQHPEVRVLVRGIRRNG